MKSIITDRLILRNFMASDAEYLLDYLSQPRAACFESEKISTLEEASNMALAKSQDDAYIAICLQDTHQVIGELFYEYEEPDTYSIGWNLAAGHEGKGYAQESAAAYFEFLFVNKAARRIYAFVEEDNYRSQRLCEKLGMRQEGLFIEFISFENNADGTPKYVNTMQYAILKKEWEKMRLNSQSAS